MPRVYRKSELLREGYEKGLRTALAIIKEMAGRQIDPDTQEYALRRAKQLANGNDSRLPKWQKYYKDKIFRAVRLGDVTIEVDRPSLCTSFYYGYGQNGVSTQEDSDNAYAQVGNEDFNQFFNASARDLNYTLNQLKKPDTSVVLAHNDEGKGIDEFAVVQQYDFGDIVEKFVAGEATPREEGEVEYAIQPNLFGYGYYTAQDFKTGKLRVATESEKQRIIKAYEDAVADVKKRCETYWKRYGNSKFQSGAYLVD